MIDLLIEFWLLPSLIVFILMIQIERMEIDNAPFIYDCNGIAPEQYSKEEWINLVCCSFLWPAGSLFIIIFSWCMFLRIGFKERTLKSNVAKMTTEKVK